MVLLNVTNGIGHAQLIRYQKELERFFSSDRSLTRNTHFWGGFSWRGVLNKYIQLRGTVVYRWVNERRIMKNNLQQSLFKINFHIIFLSNLSSIAFPACKLQTDCTEQIQHE